MSKQVSIPGYITVKPAERWEKGDPNVIDGMAYQFWAFKPTSHVLICEHTMTFEVPEDFDPRPQQIAALKKQEQKLRAEFSKAVMEINAQIASLEAIEYTPEPA